MENDDVESEEEDDTEDADAEEEEEEEEKDRSQDRAACFVRACAVEMHFNISQEPLCTGIYRKTAAPQIEPRMHNTHTHTHTHLLAHFVRACAVEMHVNTSHEPLYTDIAGKMPRPRLRPERRYTLCASLRNRSACQHFTKATLYGYLQEKCRGPEAGPALCASLRGRNAGQHFTRSVFFGAVLLSANSPNESCSKTRNRSSSVDVAVSSATLRPCACGTRSRKQAM